MAGDLPVLQSDQEAIPEPLAPVQLRRPSPKLLKTAPRPAEPYRSSKFSSPLRIFFLVDSFNTGGTEIQAVELARRMDPGQHQVTLGCLRDDGPLRTRIEDTPISIVEFHPASGVKSVSGVYQLLRLATFLRQRKFDVVHTHDLWSNLLGVPAARLAGIPIIVSSRRDLSHGDWYTRSNRRVLSRILRLSTAIVVNSKLVLEDVLRNDGLPSGKVRVVYNGIDVDRFRVQANREHLFPGIGGAKLAVLVGNMHSDVKGHPWLIRAAREVLRRFPKVKFVLVGEGERRPAFQRLAQEVGVENQVLFLGPRQDVPEILSCCDIGLSSSTAEGFPNAVLEYLAAGLPTIATAVGGSLELIANGVTGLLVSPRDERALSAAILRLLEDPQLAKSLAVAGRQHAEGFSFECLLATTTELYSELLDGRACD
jgi:glycosyltransferase involved in cell wall biosynthesis